MFYLKKTCYKKFLQRKDLPLGKELKAQTDIAKKPYQKLDDTFGFDKIIKKEEPTLKKYKKSILIYSSKYSFYKYYCDSKNFT